MRRRPALRGTICSAGIALAMLAPVITASATPAAGWTAVARNGRGVSFVGHGVTAAAAAKQAMSNCQHSSTYPNSCHIVSDRRS